MQNYVKNMNFEKLKPISLLENENSKEITENILITIVQREISLENINQEYFKNPTTLFKDLDKISRSQSTVIQLFNTEDILSKELLNSSVYFALMAEKNKRLISKSLSLEYLVYTSTQRQISIALKTFGFKFNKSSNKQIITCLITGKSEESLKLTLDKWNSK